MSLTSGPSTGSTRSWPRRAAPGGSSAVDNEQYVDWIRGRFGVDLAPAAGFDAIHGLLDSAVEYRRLDALAVGELDEDAST